MFTQLLQALVGLYQEEKSLRAAADSASLVSC